MTPGRTIGLALEPCSFPNPFQGLLQERLRWTFLTAFSSYESMESLQRGPVKAQIVMEALFSCTTIDGSLIALPCSAQASCWPHSRKASQSSNTIVQIPLRPDLSRKPSRHSVHQHQHTIQDKKRKEKNRLISKKTLLPRHPLSARIKPPVTSAVDAKKKHSEADLGCTTRHNLAQATSQDAQSAPDQSDHKNALSYERFMQGTRSQLYWIS